MDTILVVNGESYWQDFLPDFKVEQKKIQSTEWLLRDGRLIAVDQNGACAPDRILWRVGAIRPDPKHRAALEIIRLSGVPCVNPAATLLQGFDRLSMLNVLQECGFPVIPFDIVSASTQLRHIEPRFPLVVKAGNYHGGFGKALVENDASWQDVKDLLFTSKDYITIEPFIDYVRDIRYLAVGAQIWAMSRWGRFWKANVQTTGYEMIPVEDALAQAVRTLQERLRADIVAVDILEERDGTRHFVEYNDIPGLSGFPDEARWALAACLNRAASQYALRACGAALLYTFGTAHAADPYDLRRIP